MLIKGTVKWFNAKRGFGFIASSDSSADVFVHHEDIQAEGFRTLEPDEPVAFELVPDAARGARAKNIVPLRETGISGMSMVSNEPTESLADSSVPSDEDFETEAPASRGRKKRSKQLRRAWEEDVDF